MTRTGSDPSPAIPPTDETAIRSALVWNFATIAFAQIGLAAIFILLAARLEPATFGIFALASVLTDVFYMLGTSAAVDAIVQRQDFSRRTLSSVTWAVAGICVVFTLIFLGVATYYASAVGAPQAAPALQALSLTTLLLPFAIGPTAVLRQRVDMKGLALLTMASAVVGGLAALATSFTTAIEWSLVVQRIVTTFTFIALATARTRMAPSFVVDVPATRAWFSSAARIFTGQGIAALTPRIVDVVMGIFFGPTIVGFFRVATRLTDMLVGLLINPFAQLWVVLLSRNAEAHEARRNVFLQLSGLTALIALPGFVGLGLTAQEVVALILPEDYAPAGPLLAVLCMLGIFSPLTNPRNAVFTALRRFNHLVWFSLLDFAITLVAMLSTAQFGPIVMLSSGAFTAIVLVLFAVPVVLRDIGVGTSELAARLGPPYTAVAAMAACLLAIHPLLSGMPTLQVFAIKAVTGAAVYCGVLRVFFRRSLFDALAVLRAR